MSTRDQMCALRGAELLRPLAILGVLLLLVAMPLLFGVSLVAQDEAIETAEEATAAAEGAADDEAIEKIVEVGEEVGYEVTLEGDVVPVEPVAPVDPVAPPKHRIRKDTQVVFGSDVRVEKNEVARDVVAIGGDVFLEGEARGDAVAVGGSAHIDGKVSGEVAAIGGSVHLGPDAEVMGDVVAVGGTVEYDENATIHGQVVEVPFGSGMKIGAVSGIGFPNVNVDWDGHRPFFKMIGVIWSLIALAVLFLIAALILLLFRIPVERVAYKAATDPWRCGLVGLLAQILFVPLLVITCLVLVISIIGIPLLLLVPFALLALGVMSLLGYAAVAYRIGLWTETRFGWQIESPYVALLVGVLFIEVWSLVASLLEAGGGFLWFFAVMFGLLGFLAEYLAWTVGFGAALMTRFGTVGPVGETAPAAPPAPPGVPGATGAAVMTGSAGTATVASDLAPLEPEPTWDPEASEAGAAADWRPEPAPVDESPAERDSENEPTTPKEGDDRS